MPTPKTETASHTRDSARTVHIQPSEASDSYFPKGATTSSMPASTSTAGNTPLTSNASTPNSHPLSPLDREYTEPSHDIDIAHQLSKEPTYWSVKGWVQRSASSNPRQEAKDLEARARKFEEVKRDLLASVGRF